MGTVAAPLQEPIGRSLQILDVDPDASKTKSAPLLAARSENKK